MTEFQITVNETGEVKMVKTQRKAREWANLVLHTFAPETMTFTCLKIEKTVIDLDDLTQWKQP